MLGFTNHPAEKHRVEELRKKIPNPDLADLQASVGDLAVKLNDTVA